MKITHEQLVKIINEEISVHLKEQDVEEGLADLFRGKQDISHYKHMPTKQTNIPSFKNMVADLEKYKNAKDRQTFLLNIITMIIKPELYTLSVASGDKSLNNQLKSIGDHLAKAYDSLSKVNFGNLQVSSSLKRTAAMSDKPQKDSEQKSKADPQANIKTAAIPAPDVNATPEKPAARERPGSFTRGVKATYTPTAITPEDDTPYQKAKISGVRSESVDQHNKISVTFKE